MNTDRSLFPLHRIVFLTNDLLPESCIPIAIGRTFFFRFAARCIQPCLPAGQIADEERFELSTIGLTSRRSAVELFIQLNWSMRFELIVSIPVLYQLSDNQFFADPKRFELLPVGLEDQCTSIMLQVNILFMSARRDSNSQLPV